MAESIGTIIQRWLKENNLEQKFRESSVPDYWGEIVGETVARHCTLERVAAGRMFIKAENPSWKQELLGRREDIRARVNERFGTEVVTEVYIV